MIYISKLQFLIAFSATVGQEFVTGCLGHSSGSLLKIDIASYTNTSGHVHIYIPYLGINTTSPFNKTFSLALDRSIALDGTRIENRGVFIKSDKDISVYATSSLPSSGLRYYSDTYVVIPIDSLGNKYEIASYDPNASTSYPSVFMVIAAFDNTLINVTFPNGTSISKTINWLNVYQEASPSTDLTGTIVQSTKPVSVLSGASYSKVASQGSSYDMLGEQLLPVNSYETYFIVPPIYSSYSFIVRMFSNQIPNRICVKDESIENCTMVGPTKWIESAPKSTALIVTSQEPISVVQYKAGANYYYMTNIPGLRQFINSYAFVVPDVYSSQTTYIAVTIRSSAIHTLRLDGSSPVNQIVHKANVPAPLNEYMVLTYTITPGYHVMNSNETNVLFGLLSFGFVSTTETAFASPVGMLMRKYNIFHE
ncbi:hypothetical protein DPMN_134641 [Dreissena polymorpha]|uniref:IgGFc-binding protein N-terminal domain-containing protein n=1 Tax=Dreissena polymorpha TaxID=45954 RepID=A0A9D4FXK0_DREPO|nr:hypothetical protein DPMN_134641 [Dreissena polymorpha]